MVKIKAQTRKTKKNVSINKGTEYETNAITKSRQIKLEYLENMHNRYYK